MKKKCLVGLSIFFVFFLTGCATLDSFQPFKSDKGALTSTIGGKGLAVQFLPGKPPLNEIDGPFKIGIKLLNYNVHDVAIDSFTLGSTYEHPNFPPITGESFSIEQAQVEQTPQGLIYKGPGTQVAYSGTGTQLRDGSLQWAIPQYKRIGDGVRTQFFVAMDLTYQPTFPFQFCAADVQTQLPFNTGCNAIETISGRSRLGFNVDTNPVIISTIEKTVISDVDVTTIQLDITLSDISVSTGNEEGNIIRQRIGTEDLALVLFNLEQINGQIDFACKSTTMLRPITSTSLDVYLREKEATIRCVGDTTLTEERFDFQYVINLQYPYHQRVTTPSVPIRTDLLRTFT